MRYKIIFSYDGTCFHGFQRQKDLKSVQKVMEDALSNLLGENIVIKGSGRTDAKVHALGQVAHFDTTKKISKNFLKKLNQELNPEINVKKLRKVNSYFHARHSALGKYYIYKINLGKFNPNYVGYVYQPKRPINGKKIKEIKNIFIGRHSFHNFVAGKREDYWTTIYKIKIKQKENILELHFIGKAFYRYMVRNLVGAMLDYAWGNVDKNILEQMINDENYKKQLKTVPGEGLYLKKVYY